MTLPFDFGFLVSLDFDRLLDYKHFKLSEIKKILLEERLQVMNEGIYLWTIVILMDQFRC